MTGVSRPYHHGNLRRALLDAALEAIGERGPSALSLRDLATRTGVSHGAPAHHFGDKAGLLTAVAAEGYERLGAELEQARRDGSFLDAGVAYVRFAISNPAHFQVMFQPALYREDDPAVAEARDRASAVLYGTAATRPDAGTAADVGAAGWCLVHGLATLWLSGNLQPLADDPVALAERLAKAAFGGGAAPENVTPPR